MKGIPRRRRMKRTLAVSTVIANLMMITITLGLAAILIAWTGSTYGLFTSGSQIFYAQRGQALQERFVVENVFFNASGTNRLLYVFVRNVGAEETNIVAFYVNGQSPPPGSITVTGSGCGLSMPTTIPVGSVCDFQLNLNLVPNLPPVKTGQILYIIVASARGNRATYSVRMYVPGT
jgi:hypothetical protein